MQSLAKLRSLLCEEPSLRKWWNINEFIASLPQKEMLFLRDYVAEFNIRDRSWLPFSFSKASWKEEVKALQLSSEQLSRLYIGGERCWEFYCPQGSVTILDSNKSFGLENLRPFYMLSVPLSFQICKTLERKYGCDRIFSENMVFWRAAIEFCNFLSLEQGLEPAYLVEKEKVTWKGMDCSGYRLPTEDEWGWAARAGWEGADEGDCPDWEENEWGMRQILGFWDWCWGVFGSSETESFPHPMSILEEEYKMMRGSTVSLYRPTSWRAGGGNWPDLGNVRPIRTCLEYCGE